MQHNFKEMLSVSRHKYFFTKEKYLCREFGSMLGHGGIKNPASPYSIRVRGKAVLFPLNRSSGRIPIKRMDTTITLHTVMIPIVLFLTLFIMKAPVSLLSVIAIAPFFLRA